MKILHVSTSDSTGGAARAAYRIHLALVASGVDSYMRVLQRGSGDMRVVGGVPRATITARFTRKLQHLQFMREYRSWHTDNSNCHTFGSAGVGLVDEINSSDADVVNLHWIADMLSVKDIGRLKKPIIWTLHDMWPFCGGEHYAPDDETARFRNGYRAGNRPLFEHGSDMNRRTWESKHQAWERQRFTIVSPSRWLADCARHSVLFAETPVHVIPHPLDTNSTWRPVSREVARVALGLPMDKLLVLMGAVGGVADPRKGGDLLFNALTHVAIRHADDMELIIYGQSQSENRDVWPCPVHWLGRVRDDRLLALAYSSADVMVVPSRQEAFGQTASEAHACGTPVVAFNVGGLSDIVEHRVTGYLARPFEVSDLADGIDWVLQDGQRRLSLSGAAREVALCKYSEPGIASQYRGLYEQVAFGHRN